MLLHGDSKMLLLLKLVLLLLLVPKLLLLEVLLLLMQLQLLLLIELLLAGLAGLGRWRIVQSCQDGLELGSCRHLGSRHIGAEAVDLSDHGCHAVLEPSDGGLGGRTSCLSFGNCLIDPCRHFTESNHKFGDVLVVIVARVGEGSCIGDLWLWLGS